ncbi:hypothetical protein Plhal304r1_c007g0030191 [Plasmopara halstedii]
MNDALASLDRGVQTLFTDPGLALSATVSHPLCDCMLQQPPLPDWRHLARFPVLKRHVLTKFRSVAVEMAKVPQTPRKRRKRSIAQQSGDVDEYKTLCLASLCQNLVQCKLLIIDEAELVESVVKLESFDILRRVIGSRLLPIRKRMLLLSFALQEQRTKCLESAVQNWIQKVSEKLLEEILEATATSGSGEPPTNRVRTRSKNNGMQEKGRIQQYCEFCQHGDSTAFLKSKCRDWDLLVKCTREIAEMLEKSGERFVSNKAMIVLSAFWDSSPVAGLSTDRKIEKRQKRFKYFVKCDNVDIPSISVVTFKQICQQTITIPSAEIPKFMTDHFQKMWTVSWEREVESVVKAGQIIMVDVICQCSKADAFAGAALLSEGKQRITQFTGFRIVSEVIRVTGVSISEIIASFAIIWKVRCSGVHMQVAAPRNVVTSTTKQILRSYLSEILLSAKVRFEMGPYSPLGLLFVLYKIYAMLDHGRIQNKSYIKHWDALMSQQKNETSTPISNQDGKNWCLFLEKCVLDVQTDSSVAMHGRDHFLQAFKNYCRTIMYTVIATGGRVISSGGVIRQNLLSEEGGCFTVRKLLAQMLTTFDEEWVSSLIAQILRARTQLRFSGENDQQGIKTLLFPGLFAGLKSTSRSNPKKLNTGQQLFTKIIHAVNAILKESESSPLYLVALMQFCEAWDVYQSTHTEEPSSKANRWGFKAMVDLDMLPELLICYDKVEVLCQEPRDALNFAAEVLQNVPNCPPTLEENLLKVLSKVKTGVERENTFIACPQDAQLVSHSSAVLQRFLCAVRSADIAQTRMIISNIKDMAQPLGELRQQLEQWFSFVKMYGTSFAGKESRFELSLLCTRLIRWYPDEFGSMRFVFMSPLDSHFVFTLKTFIKEAARVNTMNSPSVKTAPLPSAVRVDMALHLYLTTAAFPDLETLTVLLTKAMIKCRSPEAFGDLANIVLKHGRVLLIEAAVATLSPPLRGLSFSDPACIQNDGWDKDKRLENFNRRSKSWIYQRNTLQILADSASIFSKKIAWSVSLFDETTSTTWLPFFLDYILKTEFCESTLRVDMLLTTLEKLMLSDGEQELRQAYWLAALLNTALIACSSRSAGSYVKLDVDLRDRLRRSTEKISQLQAIASTTMEIDCNNCDTFALSGNKVIGLIDFSRRARLSIEEYGGSWICEHQIEENLCTTLQINLSDVYEARMEDPSAMVIQPSIQYFLPFVHWLSAALIYSQSFLDEPSPLIRRWERTFTCYVTDVYLHVEFTGITSDLLKAWLTTWLNFNFARGQDDQQLLALLPSQVALFRRLGLIPSRSRPQSQDSTSIWQLILAAITLALNQDRAMTKKELEQAAEVVVSTLTTLELTELSAFSDYTILRDIEPFFTELKNILLRPQLRDWNIDPLCCLLQYPLEVLVCCYACRIPADSVVESQLFLERTKAVLQATSITDKDASSKRATEMNAILQYWADEMLLKYDYVNRSRCVHILEVIQLSLRF